MKKRAWQAIVTLLLLVCMLTGQAALSLAEETVQTGTNMLDGSKIEGVKVVWVTRDSTVNNEGQAVSQQELDDTDHLYLATNGHGNLSMVYKIEVQFSGQYDYGPGDITITIPAQVWRSRTYEKTGTDGETVGVVGEGGLIGKLELPVPQAPSTRSDFNWQLINGNYVLTNTRTIGATSSVSIEASIYGLNPVDIVDMSESLPITAHCEVVTNLGNTIELTSTPITAQIDTIAKITSVHKDGELFETVPPGLPAKLLQRLPEGTSPSDYLYIRWYSYHSHVNNQPYSLDIEDTLFDAYRMVDGERVKVTDGIMLGCSNYDGIVYPTTDDGQIDLTAEIVDHTKGSGTGFQYDRTVYVWSAYRKDDFYVPKATEPQVVYNFENKITWTLTETDKETQEDAWGKPADVQKVTRASDTAILSYAPVQWRRPTGAFSVDKWTEEVGSKDWLYGYALNKLESGVDVDMDFIVRTTGYGYPWTTPQTKDFTYQELNDSVVNAELEEMELNQDLMGTLGWQQITDDFQTFFNFENTPLTAEDFQFKSLRVGTPHKERYDKNSAGKWKYIADSSLPNPDLKIEFQLNGSDEWIPAATATWGEGGLGSLAFVDVNEGAGVSTSGASVLFPDNVTDIRHSFISNVFAGQKAEKCDIAMIRWDVYPTITMKASPRVQGIVAQLFENTDAPSTKFKNDVVMDVYGWVDYDADPGRLVLNNDFDYSRATFAGASYGVHLSKSVSFNPASKENGGDNDVENQWAILHYTAVATEQSNLRERAEYDEAVAEGVIPAETSGIWYDLLPEGVVPLLETVRLRSDDQITNMYTVQDYNGTGRILLVVEAELTPKPHYVNNAGYADSPALSFDAVYSWENANELGSRVINYVAFESTVDNLRHNVLGTQDGKKGENDTPISGNNNTTPSMPEDIARAMTDLDPNTDEGRFVYGRADVNVARLNYAVSGLEKRVKNDLVGIWTQGLSGQEQVTVYEGHNYTYRLNVSSSANTYTANIIIYDTLENYIIPDPDDEEQYDVTKAEDFAHTQERTDWEGDWQGKGQWRGTLTSVDLGEFIKKGVAPRLYYATLPGLQFSDTDADDTDDNFQDDTGLFNSGNYDLENEVWTLAQLDENGVWQVPDGVQVTAVALDATRAADGNPFILQPENEMTAYLHMRAPDDESDEDVWNAKGAYARVTDDNGEYVLDENGRQMIDWDAAMDPANNMYAYNNTRMKCTQSLSNIVTTDFRMIRNDYTRVGIVPEIVTVTKVWEDQDNHDNIRPQSVEVKLMRRLAGVAGEAQPVPDAQGQPLTAVLSEENNWKHTFLQVDIVNEYGMPYLYSFVETPVEGYTSKTEFVDANHYTVRNIHPNEQVDISGRKEWDDNDNALELRPDKITVNLLRDGEKIDSRVVKPDSKGNWAYSFGKRDKYAAGGREYVYTLEENYVPKYLPESENYTLLENAYIPYGDLEVSKTLVNATEAAAENEFTFTLVLLAEQTDATASSVPLMEEYPYTILEETDGQWQEIASGKISSGQNFTLRGGQKLRVEGLPSESTYAVTEEELPGFTCEAENDEGTIRAGKTAQASFTNTYASSGTLQLSAGKGMTGHAIRKNQFRFEVVDMNEGSATYGQVIRTAAVNAPENTEGGVGEEILSEADLFFGQIQYSTADDGKVFHYEVREKDGGKSGYTYDDTVYTVDVTVNDNGDGTMTVTPVFTNRKTGRTADSLAFENRYEARGEVTFKAWKTLEARNLEEGEFTFQLFQYDAETNTLGERISEVKNDADGNVVFPSLSFDQDDVSLDDASPATYTYLIQEKRGTDKTVVYSDQAFIITLKVYDNGDGTLSFVQDQQLGVRNFITCPDCIDMEVTDYPEVVGKDVPYLYFDDELTSAASTSCDFCPVCKGMAYVGGALCTDCKGSGLKLGGILYYANSQTPNWYYTFTRYVQPDPNARGWVVGVNSQRPKDHTYNMMTCLEVLSQYYTKCSTCDNAKEIEGDMTVTGETVVPVFENTLKPGDLSVTKTVQGSGSENPAQKFKFHVKLTGEHLPEELEYELTRDGELAGVNRMALANVRYAFSAQETGVQGAVLIGDEEEAQAGAAQNAAPAAQNEETTENTPYHMPAEVADHVPFAVLDADGNMVFFRVPKNEDGTYTYEGVTFADSDFSSHVYEHADGQVYFELEYREKGVTGSSYFPWRNKYKDAITKVSMTGAFKPLSATYLFQSCPNITSAELLMLDLSECQGFNCIFNACTALTDVKIHNWDTSSAGSLWSIFSGCTSLETVDIGNWDTSNVYQFEYLFDDCVSLKSVSLASWDFSDGWDFDGMFLNCESLTDIDASEWNVAPTFSYASMRYMFAGCDKLKKLDLRKWDVTYVRDFYQFCQSCPSLEWVDLSTWKSNTVTDCRFMFTQCPEIKYLNMQNFNVRNANIYGMLRVGSQSEAGRVLVLGTGFDASAISSSKKGDFFTINSGWFAFTRVTIADNTNLVVRASEIVPNNDLYSGKWVNVDTGELLEDGEGLTATQRLFSEGGHGGTWEWDVHKYKVTLLPGEGAGTMPAIYCPINKSLTFTPAFYYFGHEIIGFSDGTEGENGQLEVTYPVNADGTFTIPANTYGKEAEVTLTALWAPKETKVQLDEDGFVLELHNGETATFRNLPAGTAYEVWEETPEGWVLVKAENDAGTIEPLQESEAKFTNRYAPNEAQAILRASKRLDGNVPRDGVYLFTLSGEGMETQEKSSVSGAVVFDPITYTTPGQYTYTLSEKAGTDDTIEYDSRSYTAEVTVTDNTKGVLSASVVYRDDQGNELEGAPAFLNRTKPGSLLLKKTVHNATDASRNQVFTVHVSLTRQGTPWSGVLLKDGVETNVENGVLEVTIQGGEEVLLSEIPAGLAYTAKEQGTLPGWTMDGTVKEGVIPANDQVEAEFENSYTLAGPAVIEVNKALVGRSLKADEFAFVLYDEQGNPVSTAFSGADGKVVFDEITYTQEGEWHYTVREVAGDDESIRYSEEELQVTVAMEDAEGEGRLTAAITYGETGDTITNEVKTGKLRISKEVISANEAHQQKQFTFTLSLTDALGQPLNGEYALDSGDVLSMRNGSGTLQLQGGETVEIDGLPHGANYTVTEAAEGGFTHTKRNASHVIDADAPAHAEFVNTYAAHGEYAFDGSKTLVGAEMEEGQFRFELKDEEGYTLETVANEADGSFAFSPIAFTEQDVGEKVFILSEVNGGVNGYTYDDTQYRVTLEIADNEDGTLTITANDLPENGIAFENTYSEETSVRAVKRWVGDEACPENRCAVTLILYAQAGQNERVKMDEKQIPADAQAEEMQVVWENLPLFTIQDGRRTDILYSLEEKMEVPAGKPVLYKGVISGDAENGFEVINRYACAEVVLEAEKTLTGGTLKENMFLFEVKDENGVVVNAANDADGKITFPAIRYYMTDMEDAPALEDGTLEKVFTYQVTEANGGVNGYIYDETAYTVQVTVTLKRSGEMSAVAAVDAEKMTFENVVETIPFSVTKQWQGGEGGLISLTLYANGEKMEPQPEYTEENGVYTYTGLRKYTEEGKAIVYSAKEKYVDGFMTIYKNVAPYTQETDMIYNGGTIINRAVTTFRVQKVWEGLAEGEAAPEITLVLYCNGEVMDKKTPAPDKDGWYIYHNLPIVYKGETAVYTVTEVPMDGFTVSYGEAAEGEEEPTFAEDWGTIVNRKIPRTGDDTAIGLWTALTAAAGCLLVLTLKKRKATR